MKRLGDPRSQPPAARNVFFVQLAFPFPDDAPPP